MGNESTIKGGSYTVMLILIPKLFCNLTAALPSVRKSRLLKLLIF